MNAFLKNLVGPALVLGIVAAEVQAEPGGSSRLEMKYLATLYTPLHAPQAANQNLLIFHPRDGGTLSGGISGEIVAPAGDWVRVMPDGTMRIDVRLSVQLDDGEMLYVTYGGVLRKPDAESWVRFMAGHRIEAPLWYYIIMPLFETTSARYRWLNGVQAVGKFVSIQTGPQAHVRFDLFAVE